MITKVKFKCISRGGVRNIVIPIEHNITAPYYNGVRMVSVEEQVIDHLDNIDKRDIMVKYDVDIIIDYCPYIRKKKKNEIEEFLKFCQNVGFDENTILRIGAVANSMKNEIFGKGYSNYRKAEILLSSLKFGMNFTSEVLDKIIKDNNMMTDPLKIIKDNNDIFHSKEDLTALNHE